MTSMRTLQGLIRIGARRQRRSLSPPGAAPPISYTALRALVDRVMTSLNGLGVGRGDRVAIVLPNGPEMATAFLAVASAATSAPLNPAYRQDEFEFYMSDLKAKALIIEAGDASPAIAAADKLGIALLTPDARTPQTGRQARSKRAFGRKIRLARPRGPAPPNPRFDVALILHTRRARPRGRRSCRWRKPISGPRLATSQRRSSLPTAIALLTSCPCSTFMD